jgi:hypothetical protein
MLFSNISIFSTSAHCSNSAPTIESVEIRHEDRFEINKFHAPDEDKWRVCPLLNSADSLSVFCHFASLGSY